MRLFTSAMSVLNAVLASLGPIVAFFSATTTNYSFILLLNVVVFANPGAFGVVFLFRMLQRDHGPVAEDDAPISTRSSVGAVFYIWLLAFGLVGAQMGWVLRMFVGSPFLPFTWFRPREASFFEAVSKSLRQLFGS